MNELREVESSISIRLKNKMAGRVNVIGVGKSSIESSILVKSFEEVESIVNVYSDNVVIKPSFPPILGNQKKASFVVSHREDLSGSLSISPKNKMAGVVEVLEPPAYHLELSVIKDTFIRNKIPTLNYGEAQSMVVGHKGEQKETFRSLIQFDTTQIPENSKIQSVKMRLFNRINNSSPHSIQIYSISTDWLEYGVTWANQPPVKELLKTVQLEGIGYTDIDVTEIIQRWYQFPEENLGFLLRAEDETVDISKEFSTRESSFDKPHLDLEYKLDIIYSVGRSAIPSSMMVHEYGESQITAALTVPKYDDDRDLLSSIHIHNFNYMIESFISVNKPDLLSVMIIQSEKDEDITGNISVRVKGGHLPQDNVNSFIKVNRPYLSSKLKLRLKNDVAASLLVTQPIIEESVRTANLLINNPFLLSTLSVRAEDDKDLTASLKIRLADDMTSQLLISNPSLRANLRVRLFEDIPASITVKQYDQIESSIKVPYRWDIPSNIEVVHAHHLEGSINIISGYLKSSIIIPFHEEKSLDGKMIVRTFGISEINSGITIGGDNVIGGYVYLF